MPSDFEKLSTIERRLVTKFISALTDSKVKDTERKKLIRSLRRVARADDKDYNLKRKNAYTVYYCERFPLIKRETGDNIKVCDIAKLVAREWKDLCATEKLRYKEMAQASRSVVTV